MVSIKYSCFDRSSVGYGNESMDQLHVLCFRLGTVVLPDGLLFMVMNRVINNM